MNRNNRRPQDTKERKHLEGRVVSMSMQKSVVIEIDSTYLHPVYQKALRITRRFLAHNELDGIAVGDIVRIEQSKPISKRKHYIVKEKAAAK